jgi:hypothetical protein
MIPIIPAIRRDPFDHPAWLFDLKLDGFRGIADTVAGRMLSKNGNRLKRYESKINRSHTHSEKFHAKNLTTPC